MTVACQYDAAIDQVRTPWLQRLHSICCLTAVDDAVTSVQDVRAVRDYGRIDAIIKAYPHLSPTDIELKMLDWDHTRSVLHRDFSVRILT